MIAQTRRLTLDPGSGEALRRVEVLVGRRARHAFDPSRAPQVGSEDLVAQLCSKDRGGDTNVVSSAS